MQEIINEILHRMGKKGSHYLEKEQWWIKNGYKDIYDKLLYLNGNSIREKMYIYKIGENDIPICPVCSKQLLFGTLSKPYANTCSKSCAVKEHYANLSAEDKEKKINKWRDGRAKDVEENPQKYKECMQTSLAYWINKGYSEYEAKQKLKERQTTFSLAKCIEKYGEKEGIKVFQARQVKWQDTLNAKSQEEIDDINRRKNSYKNLSDIEYKKRCIKASHGRMICKFNKSEEARNIPAKLYYIKFFNEDIEFWKIGITINSLDKRFGSEISMKRKYGLNREVIFTENDTYYNVFQQEQKILKENETKRIIIDYKGFTTTEAFNKDIRTNII